MELYEYAIGAIIYAAGWYSSYKVNFAKLHNYKHLLRLQKNIGNIWRSKYNELKRDKSSCSLPVVSTSVDLQELERKIDEALENETNESLTKWLKEQRNEC